METQEFVSQVIGVPSNRINARVKRLGGAFGGKESRSVPIACAVAIAAKKEKRPMRCMLDRDEDMITSGQRHPVQARWKVGAMKDGTLIALDMDIYNNAGYSCDMSTAVMVSVCAYYHVEYSDDQTRIDVLLMSIIAMKSLMSIYVVTYARPILTVTQLSEDLADPKRCSSQKLLCRPLRKALTSQLMI